MRTGSLFSGYDGLGLAVDELFPGNERAWFCEYDDAPSKILAHHWPTVLNHRDVTEIDWTAIEPVDILTGGYPCQPFSAAGQRKGTDDERHLWPFVREAIRHLRPRFTLLENVAGHRSLGFDRVLGDLAEDGMHVRWTSIRASDIGAPHHRERVFILVTDPERDGWQRRSVQLEGPSVDSAWNGSDIADTEGIRPSRINDGVALSLLADPEGVNPGGLPVGVSAKQSRSDRGERLLPHTESFGRGVGYASDEWALDREVDSSRNHSHAVEWGKYAPAIRRWERATRRAPDPTRLNSNGNPQLAAEFAEWLMGLPAGHVTGVPGITRAQALKAIGNGVCPPQAVAGYSPLLLDAA